MSSKGTDPVKVKRHRRKYYEGHKEKARARAKAWYRANTERAKANQKRYKEANREKVEALNKRWREENAEHFKEQRRWYAMQYYYGITKDEWLVIYNEQHGTCAVCLKVIPPYPSYDSHVDHNHATGAVRGIVCRGCNTAIGYFETHDSERIREYLSGGESSNRSEE